ncbi:MAG: 5-oxoprolinase [Sphingomonas sp.]|nr:MAG: 5-oxoprolinase [Sphingomonas sp.]
MNGWQFWIDRGGTFTDVVARDPAGHFSTVKMLSENPERYRDAAVAGIRTALGLALDAPLPGDTIDHIKMGTTVATNALLERKGARTLLLVDEGFADLLEIGHQARPRLFDLAIAKQAPLYEAVEEVGGRVGADGSGLRPLDEAALAETLARRRAEGFTSCAIALVHAWKYPETERRIAALARAAGFEQVSASHEISALMGLVARGGTTVLDAYLSPVLRRYVDQVTGELQDSRVYFMQSNGGLTAADLFQGKDAILSGPAGGIVGAARTAQAAGFANVIGFDMGGTSTDVALYAGAFERTVDAEVAGIEVRVPMMAINTVAAGGGSILQFDGARFRVGPESAGANPGPACYRRGGPLTVTDANVLLGKLNPRHFPAIFGPEGNLPLDRNAVQARFAALAETVTNATGQPHSAEDVAEGFLRIAVANMAAAIKQVTLEKGQDPTAFALVCFGGAGGQHACLVADELGMGSVLVHPFAGVLSAYGMGLADQSAVRQQAIERPFDEEALRAARETAAALSTTAAETVRDDKGGAIDTIVSADLRYAGTDTALTVALAERGAMEEAFHAAHRTRFGFATPERALILESVTAEAIRRGEPVSASPLAPREGAPLLPIEQVSMHVDGGFRDVPVFDRDTLAPGDHIVGPAIIRETTGTTVVEQGWTALVEPGAQLLLTRATPRAEQRDADGERADPVLLELFNSMFMAVAEQMGAVLRNTSTSVNIKERLDFSCALFDAEGRLIANAPHVPVHLGAMGECVRTVLANRRDALKPGDMIAINDPFNGGTHLPDVTVVAPVFDADGKTLLFFVGNRGHHADIGGTTPGSTPSRSRTLEEEGVVIDNFLLLDGGEFREEAFRALLTGAPYPARNPDTNVADIKAQIAANEAGIAELRHVIARHGWPLVSRYMGFVLANAEESIRRVIDRIGDGRFDYEMDDGSLLRVTVSVDRANRSATIDFAGTAEQRPGNFNAPPAVTTSVILYVFRCLVDSDLPLNEGCLAPLDIRIPAGSFLSPAPGSAVVAGNTEVSQAVANALLGALGASAASQGTMNNFLFGNERYQYYETICGGTGAGPDFDGASAVHSHMTNTRITDPEILELRYPVRLERFAVRRGSGGAGAHRGGDGVMRAVRMLEPMTATIVASRRTRAPFGLSQGGPGASGRQWIERADGLVEHISGTADVELAAGDLIAIETPGGGGYGAPADGGAR